MLSLFENEVKEIAKQQKLFGHQENGIFVRPSRILEDNREITGKVRDWPKTMNVYEENILHKIGV